MKKSTSASNILRTWEANSVSKALESNMSAKFAHLPRLVNASRVTSNGLTIIDSGHNCDMFNIICCTKTSEASQLKVTIDSFAHHKRPFAWWVGFEGEPEGLGRQLEEIGLVRTENELGMAVRLADLKKKGACPELTISAVDSISSLKDFVSVITRLVPKDASEIEAFYKESCDLILKDASKLQLFVGYLSGSPVSTSALFCDCGVVGVWDVITLPEARGKGIGTEMTFAALQEGKKRGFEIGVLTASDEGQPVYRKLGFEPMQSFHVYNLAG